MEKGDFSPMTPAEILDLDKAMEKPYQEYWKELGKFIHHYSLAEQRLLSLLYKFSGVKEVVGGAIFDGTRTDAAKDKINRILEVTNRLDIKKRLEPLFAQLGTINTIRNHLVHWGASNTDSGQLLVSNAFLSPPRLKEFEITPTDLRNMQVDLIKIGFFLLLEEANRDWANSRPWVDWLGGPWLYIPPQPSPQQKTPQPPRSPI